MGVAAHVTAASQVAPATTRRSRQRNGKALATESGSVNPGQLVDNDEARYTKELLARWKLDAEQEALREIESPSAKIRPSDMDALKEYGLTSTERPYRTP